MVDFTRHFALTACVPLVDIAPDAISFAQRYRLAEVENFGFRKEPT
jgi:hypothetical protein